MATGDITGILRQWPNGRTAVLEQLMPAVHAELGKIAAGLMQQERSDHTLQPTALINEAYLRLVRQDIATWEDRAHFYGIAARTMRQILVEHARRRSSQKRGCSPKRVLDHELAVGPGNFEVLLDLDDALTRMADWDARKLEVLELHYFAGLTAEEICEALDLRLPTVRRDLILGRAWLREQFA